MKMGGYFYRVVGKCQTRILFLLYFSLQVVSTRVGGVPEVLPPELLKLADPNVSGD